MRRKALRLVVDLGMPGLLGVPNIVRAAARLHEQRIDMPVIAADALDDEIAALVAARSEKRDGGSSIASVPAVDEADHLHRRQRREDGRGQFGFKFGRRAVAGSVADAFAQRRDGATVGVADDHRPITADVSRCTPSDRYP